jgi:hypothetical protein
LGPRSNGFRAAVADGVAKDGAGVLVDEEFGAAINLQW